MLSVVWVISIIAGCSNFFRGLTSQTWGYEICELVESDNSKIIHYYIHPITTSLSLAINVFSYVNILVVIRRIRHRFDSRTQSTARHGRPMVTTLLFIFTFILLYLPYDVIDTAYHLKIVDQNVYVHIVCRNLGVYQKLNCIFDPLIYALRQPDVLNGVKRCLCCFPKHPPRTVRCRSRLTLPKTTAVRSHVTSEL